MPCDELVACLGCTPPSPWDSCDRLQHPCYPDCRISSDIKWRDVYYMHLTYCVSYVFQCHFFILLHSTSVHLFYVAGIEIMIQLIVNSVSLVQISRKPKAKRHWQCKYLWIYHESYRHCSIQAYYILDALLILCGNDGYRDCRSYDSHASILLTISPLYTP